MTIEDIKDYMDKVFEDYLNNKIGQYTFIGKMCKVRYMLNQVDESQKAHYIEIDNRIDETEPLEYQCSNCKKRFYYDEVYDYCVKCGCEMENAKEILGE